jgi:hypothetical protein
VNYRFATLRRAIASISTDRIIAAVWCMAGQGGDERRFCDIAEVRDTPPIFHTAATESCEY